jgi:hypothetical protein
MRATTANEEQSERTRHLTFGPVVVVDMVADVVVDMAVDG